MLTKHHRVRSKMQDATFFPQDEILQSAHQLTRDQPQLP
jgi:hypothetical protein